MLAASLLYWCGDASSRRPWSKKKISKTSSNVTLKNESGTGFFNLQGGAFGVKKIENPPVEYQIPAFSHFRQKFGAPRRSQ